MTQIKSGDVIETQDGIPNGFVGIDPKDLLTKIGALTVEVDYLREQNAGLEQMVHGLREVVKELSSEPAEEPIEPE